MDNYAVIFNGWHIKVKAETKKKANYQAYLKFKDEFGNGTSFIDFVYGIEETCRSIA